MSTEVQSKEDMIDEKNNFCNHRGQRRNIQHPGASGPSSSRACHVDLIVSDYGWMLLKEEVDIGGKRSDFESYLVDKFGVDIKSGVLELHNFHDLAAPLSSGSVHSDGMVVVPCTMKILSGVAHGSSSNLIERSADVTPEGTEDLDPRSTGSAP